MDVRPLPLQLLWPSALPHNQAFTGSDPVSGLSGTHTHTYTVTTEFLTLQVDGNRSTVLTGAQKIVEEGIPTIFGFGWMKTKTMLLMPFTLLNVPEPLIPGQ